MITSYSVIHAIYLKYLINTNTNTNTTTTTNNNNNNNLFCTP